MPSLTRGPEVKSTRPELPREFVAVGKRRRIMSAMAELCAERGYGSTKIGDLVSRAGVARKTLYENFDGKEAVFLAAFDDAVAEMNARIEEACAAAGEGWDSRIAAGTRAFLGYVAEEPARACMCLVEAKSATPTASQRYDEALQRLVEMLRSSAPPNSGLPPTTEETVVGGVAWILHQQIRQGKAAEVGDLVPQLTDFVLSPYFGATRRRGDE